MVIGTRKFLIGEVVNAYCTNANDDSATEFIFKISDIELRSLDSIWLHRGRRKEDVTNGPIKILMNSAVTVDLSNGEFTISKGIDCLETEINYGENLQAGPRSGSNLITAKDSSMNFIEMKVQGGVTVVPVWVR
jgi:hypothetical protein